jgi:hypothetical protein
MGNIGPYILTVTYKNRLFAQNSFSPNFDRAAFPKIADTFQTQAL